MILTGRGERCLHMCIQVYIYPWLPRTFCWSLALGYFSAKKDRNRESREAFSLIRDLDTRDMVRHSGLNCVVLVGSGSVCSLWQGIGLVLMLERGKNSWPRRIPVASRHECWLHYRVHLHVIVVFRWYPSRSLIINAEQNKVNNIRHKYTRMYS